jgi:START domain
VIQIDEFTAIRRVACKPVWPTAPRDFVVCTTWEESEDGCILLCTRSVPDHFKEKVGNYVRGFINVSGYYIQPKSTLDPSDPAYNDCPEGGCKVTLAAHTELGGSLPASVINMLSTAAPVKILNRVRDITSAEK